MSRVVVPALQATQPGGIGPLESILGLLKILIIRALVILPYLVHEGLGHSVAVGPGMC